MPIDYNKLDLSKKELMTFLLCAFVVSYILGELFFDSAKAVVCIFLTSFMVIPVYKRKIRKDRKAELLVEFRDLLYSISSSISSGRNMSQALTESVDFWEGTYCEEDYIMIELHQMNLRLKNGNEKDTVVLKDFAQRSGLDDIDDFVNVYISSKETGGDIPLAIERATSIIGDKISLDGELKSMIKQKEFESRIVAISPLAVVLFLRITAPDYIAPMFDTLDGRVIMGISLFIMCIAVLLMEKINKIDI